MISGFRILGRGKAIPAGCRLIVGLLAEQAQTSRVTQTALRVRPAGVGGECIPDGGFWTIAWDAAPLLIHPAEAKPGVRIAQCGANAEPPHRLLVVLAASPTIGVAGTK